MAHNSDLANESWRKRAEELRTEAEKLPFGRARDALLKQARHLEAFSKMTKWIASPGLRPPRSV